MLPVEPTFEHYIKLIKDTSFPIYFRNSVLLATATTLVVIGVATLGAYSLVRFSYRGRESLAMLVLFTYLLPSVVLILPLYLMMVNLGLELDSNRIYEIPTRQRRSLDYQVAVDILRFDGTLNGKVILGARWTLLSGDGKHVLVSKVSSIEETVNAPSYESFVGAQSRAVVQLARDVADSVKKQSTKSNE